MMFVEYKPSNLSKPKPVTVAQKAMEGIYPRRYLVEFPPELPDCVFIGHPDVGYVTVDFTTRKIGWGRCPAMKTIFPIKRTGRGWHARIVEDAVGKLTDLQYRSFKD